MSSNTNLRFVPTLAALALLLLSASGAAATADGDGTAGSCPAERAEPLVPTDPARCAELAAAVRDPSALSLRRYEETLNEFLAGFCHRNTERGWVRDKGVRDTGPYTATFADGAWTGTYHGTHQPVVIWYSREMVDWLRANRPEDGSAPAGGPAPVPDGAIMVKEMLKTAPAARCADVDPLHLMPTAGAAVMVRDREASHDGWFWGWYGWPGQGWSPDWPAGAEKDNRYPYMAFAQYCLNCHASARDDSTFASLENVQGEAGEPLVFLSQTFFESAPTDGRHGSVGDTADDPERHDSPLAEIGDAFRSRFRHPARADGDGPHLLDMPSETYDYTWVGAGGPGAASEFLTSSQCLGCHDAGSTGLQFDMTEPDPENGDKLLNLSPYATWRTSPMGLGGRDPIFYAQLASETETFHPEISETLQDICLGCHGVMGQRQFKIDGASGNAEGGASSGDDGCEPFLRSYAEAVPFPHDNPQAHLADYGALARDGISCTACHRMRVGEGGTRAQLAEPWNRCVEERQELLNPDSSGFARTFTGSFVVGPPGELRGPFDNPKTAPMDNALGIVPVHDPSIRASELCGSCHTVHLPVVAEGKTIARTYEQTTYPEWAMSAYRTGETPSGQLPAGAGSRAESCQSCHMSSTGDDGKPLESKIASIQERSNFPEASHVLGADEIDLEVREGFARHTLVGLNVFFVEMAQQFPDLLGIRTQDPMLVGKGLDPVLLTERKMLEQASESTAAVEVVEVERGDDALAVTVTVTSDVGHKFPSGVGFRRAFLELAVLDDAGGVLWASGRTDGAGVIVDESGEPVAGELWWTPDCSRRYQGLDHQPHYQVITRQDQAQIYQELVTAPPDGADSECGLDVPPRPPFTTSFLSICGHVKDNRILPHGFLALEERTAIARALGAGEDLARDTGPHAVGDDPDYVSGGGDSLRYEIALADLAGEPAGVEATLYYQAIPPFYLQDRFCTARSRDTARLHYLAGHLDLEGTRAEDWKLEVVTSERVAVE